MDNQTEKKCRITSYNVCYTKLLRAPKVTEEHGAWYRLIDNVLKQEIWERPAAV